MKNKAFTLIELLITILIIGILAAIALPQYQVAVAKAHFAGLKELVNQIVEAQEYHHLLTGSYANKFEELGIELPPGKLNTSTASHYKYTWGDCQLFVDAKVARCESNLMGYQRRYSLSSSNNLCIYYATDRTSPQAKVCQQETKHKAPDLGTLKELAWYY